MTYLKFEKKVFHNKFLLTIYLSTQFMSHKQLLLFLCLTKHNRIVAYFEKFGK